MNLELEALENNDTWDIVTLSTSKKAIGSKWLYKTKFKPDGTIKRYKSIIVILGYRKTYSVDYEHTLAPVAKMMTVRALLAVAALQSWIIIQMDVTNAFLHGELYETV
ncbi:putative mitochondrial protein AtMg00820 [Apium graveolens]|uniref:putative mitochondrial protein AtMg00820 n=1 Tax=Apium graveolens TaxID=4045 RepID=UPI003D79AE32